MQTNVDVIVLIVVIYLRVSTEDQARKGYSLPEQRDLAWKKARELAQELRSTTGLQVELQAHEFADDFGGDILERPTLEAVRQFIRERRPRHFICLNPDRFSRSLELQLMITREILSVGCSLDYLEYDFNPDPEGMLQYQVRGAVSEFEKKQILKRTSRGKERKVRQGGRPNGACPYGYVHDKAADQLKICDEEAQWVRRMFEWAANEFMGARTISRKLNELGVPTKRNGGRWQRTTVRRILSNTSYVGEMRCNRYDFKGLTSTRRLPREKRKALTPRRRPEQEWITVPVPSIVDKALFDRVQLNLEVSAKRGGRRDTGLLSMLAECGVCGSGMHYARNPRGYNYLRCARRYPYLMDYREGTPSCPSKGHRIEPIEDQVWQLITEWLTDPNSLREYLGRNEDNDSVVEQIGRLKQEKDAIEQRLSEQRAEQRVVVQQQARGRIADAEADAMLDEISVKLQRLSATATDVDQRIAALTAAVSSSDKAVSAYAEMADRIAEQGASFREELSLMGPEHRRETVLRLIRRVIVYQDGSVRVVPVS